MEMISSRCGARTGQCKATVSWRRCLLGGRASSLGLGTQLQRLLLAENEQSFAINMANAVKD